MLISIVPPKRSSYEKKDRVGFYVRTDPEDNESDKIKAYVAPYESGDVKEVLEFAENFRNLIRLKALEQNGPALFQHARLLLREDALTTFTSCHEDAT
jgi:hypothetical protein